MKSKTFTVLFLLLTALFTLNFASAQTMLQVLVNSRGTHSIQSYDVNGNFTGDFISSGAGGLSGPEDIIFHPDGTVLVSGFGNTVVKRYDALTGAFIGDFSSGYPLATPSKMSIGPDSLIYVTQWGATQNKVVRFDLNGAFVDEFTSIDVPNGIGHVWDSAGNFYVASYGNGSNGVVHRFDTAGNHLGIFINSTVLQGPTHIWWDTNGDLLVNDWSAGTVLRYDSAGNYLSVFATGITNPEGIAFLPGGKLLIGDWGQDAVHLLDSTGTSLGYFCSGNGLTDPNGVKVREVQAVAIEEPTAETNFVSPAVGEVFRINLDQYPEVAEVKVLNMQGQEVARLGQVRTWQAGNVAEGIYFVVADLPGKRRMQKVWVRHP